jgi:peptidoglycan/xylan/chitin deacetylase (PgdA/CDA1 family)/uncharacterized protein YgiM (DUF1202 family)
MDRHDSGDGSRPGLSRRRFLAGALGAAAMGAGGYRLVTAQSAAGSITRGPTDVNRVALTFDCGADVGYTAAILDTLASNGIACSFGMTGQFADANPDMVRRMVAEGHHLMNHTYTHPSFTGASTSGTGPLSEAKRREQIESTENRLVALAGTSTKPYFRPPYGDFDQATLELLGEMGYSVNALWTLDVNGWRGITRTQVVNRVAANHGNGYIYLMHVGADSQEGPALPQIISTLRSYGYGFASLPGLLSGEGTDPTPPQAKFVAGDSVKVTAGLYLRTGAGTGSGVITTMPTGTVCTVIGGPTLANGYSWYQVDSPYGQGWAAGEFLEKTTATPPPPPPTGAFAAGDTVRVTTRLYLRTGAGASTSVVNIMDAGTVCTVVSGPVAAGGYAWYQLDTPYGRGWAAGEYLAKVTGGTAPPPPATGGFEPGTTVKVTAGLYLRTGPGTGTRVITTMPTGTVCTIVSGPSPANGYTWYEVDTPYGRGWAAGEFLAATTSPPPSTGGYPTGTSLRTTDSLRLRSSGSASASIVATMPAGTVCTVVGGPAPSGGYTWYQLDTPYGRGWAAGEYLTRA